MNDSLELTLFWTATVLMGYAWIGFPLLLILAGRFVSRTVRRNEAYFPQVSIILSVYNEEEVICEKLDNFLALRYPPEHTEIIVVSDGSDDRTEELVRLYRDPRIRLIAKERGGKTTALNCGVAEAEGEILVFTDANAMFNPDAVGKLVRNFADSAVGLVNGRSYYRDRVSGKITAGGMYRSYEVWLKSQESRFSSIAGADGAIYALRADLYEPLPPRTINDLIHPLQVVMKGFRAIKEPEAVNREFKDEEPTGELRRQTRIMAQAWYIFLTQFGLLLQRKHFIFAWIFFSHKVLRWLTFPLFLISMLAAIPLLDNGLQYILFFLVQTAFLVLGIAGFSAKTGILHVLNLFLVLHLAAMTGLWRLVKGDFFVTWNPRDS
jgi:cellulose synthase/poly-beta-1,6-N-acetylglucosamine synthase-like glycosyltransferase